MSTRKIEDLMQCVDATMLRDIVSADPDNFPKDLYKVLLDLLFWSTRNWLRRSYYDYLPDSLSYPVRQALKARGFTVSEVVLGNGLTVVRVEW
jgi:hypothetical protein